MGLSDTTNMEIQDIHTVHFVGIAGVAMTALAVYAKERGITVTGSDVQGVFPTRDSLQRAGITVTDGFSPDHITKDIDVVIFTGAHNGKENIEVKTATERNILVMSHGEALGFFMKGAEQISVAGSHGKTTTSAMIATIFSVAGRNPSYAIGCGDIKGLGPSGHFGTGNMFIVEADEYITDPHHDPKPRFLWQHPDILVVTNIDYDHPDAYGSLADVKAAFMTLVSQQQGRKITILNADDKESSVLTDAPNVLLYGFSPRANACITHVGFGEEQTFFTLSMDGTDVGEFILHVPGRHNVLNATAAALCALSYGLSWDEIKKGLAAFYGTKRRFEKIGEANNIVVYDDYAHHPKEITASLEAARAWFPNRAIITIFQPHTYSRTKALLNDFATCFASSDVVLLTDIFGSARETDSLGMTTEKLVEQVAMHHKNVQYTKDIAGTLAYIEKNVVSGAVIIVMGAGDIYEWGPDIVKQIKKDANV